MPVPFVADSCGAFYEEEFGVAVLDPVLGEERVEDVLEGEVVSCIGCDGRLSPGVWMWMLVVRIVLVEREWGVFLHCRPVVVVWLDAEDESYGGASRDVGWTCDFGVGVCV